MSTTSKSVVRVLARILGKLEAMNDGSDEAEEEIEWLQSLHDVLVEKEARLP